MSISSASTNASGKLLGLPRDLDYIPDELRRRAATELFEDEDTIIHSLKLLRSMLKEEKGLVYYDEDWFLLAALRTKKFDVKRAFQTLKNTYTVTGKRAELYHNYNFEKARKTFKGNDFGFLPYRDDEGCVILVVRLVSWDPQVNPLKDVCLAVSSGLIQVTQKPATQIAGLRAIFDMNGMSLQLLPHLQPKYVKLFAQFLQDIFPLRVCSVHIVNENQLFSYIWAIIKKLITKKIRERFHFHGTDVKGLHKYISPTILPADYAGDLPPFDNSEWASKMEESVDLCNAFFGVQGYEKYRKKSQRKNTKDH